MASEIYLDDICRLCVRTRTKNPEMIMLKITDLLRSKVEEITSRALPLTELHPCNVCGECADNVENFHFLKNMIIRKQIQLEELLQLNDVEGLDSDLLDNIEECYVKGEPIEEYLEDDHAMTSEVISTERSKSAGCNMQYKIATLLNKIIQHNNSAMKGLAEPRKVATEKVLQSLKDSFKNGSSLKEGPIVQVIEDASEVIVVDPHDEPQSIETIVMHQNNSRKASTIVVHPNDVNNSKIPTYRITAAPPARGPGSRPRKHANPPPPPVEREPLKFDKRPRLVITPKYLQTLENQRNNTNAEAETYIQFEEIIEVDESQDEEENGMNLVQQEEATDMESDSGENVIGERTRFFNCKTCGVGCPSDLERDVHIKLMHPVPKMTFNGPYKCWYCERIFKLEYSGRKHIILTHLKIHLCPDCGLSFETSAKYLHHRYNVHGTVYTCPEEGCGKQFMGNAKIRDHKETHKDISERKVLVCDRCGSLYLTRDNLIIHLRKCDGSKFKDNTIKNSVKRRNN